MTPSQHPPSVRDESFWQKFNDQIDLKCTLMQFELRDEFEHLTRSIGQKLRAGTGAKWVWEEYYRRHDDR